jgi:single-stranded DNA-binding protein
MNVDINVVVQSGVVRYPALRYNEQSKPEFRFVLTRTTEMNGQTFTLSIPCCAVGATAEKLAGEIDEGHAIVITAGELVYRKRDTKDGPKSRLEILVWRCQVERSAGGPVSQEVEPEILAPEPKPARRPRYPKYLGQPSAN